MTNKGLRAVKRAIRRLILSVVSKPLAPATNSDKELVEELRSAFRDLPCRDSTSWSRSEKEWLNNMKSLRELVLSQNPRKFLGWHLILRTMFVGNKRYVSTELNFLRGLAEWETRWCEAIIESQVGHPMPYWKYPRSSGNLIHHAYHIAQFEQKTAIYVHNVDFVFEFGGGYGSMCRLFHNLGFQGKYIIFDLPGFGALQSFFLKSIGIRVHSVKSFKTSKSGVVCISDLELLTTVLEDHDDFSNSMFVATWSVSETPANLRGLILSLLGKFKGFLISYQDQFEEVNNIEFFRNWVTTQNDVKWYNWQIQHLEHNKYLIGKRIANK